MNTTAHRRHSTNGMISSDRLRTGLRNQTIPSTRCEQTQRQGGINRRRRRLRRRWLLLDSRRAGYGAAPPASRVADAIADATGLRPPLTPEPRRPLTGAAARAGPAALPDRRAALRRLQDPQMCIIYADVGEYVLSNNDFES